MVTASPCTSVVEKEKRLSLKETVKTPADI
jgi:hypothetical protein